jgi:hypothetical protein
MNRRQRAWVVLSTLCVVGCGGRAEDAQSPDLGAPPSGFYSVSWQTVSDTCQLQQPSGSTVEVVSAKANGANIVFYQSGRRRQDIVWEERLFHTWDECGATFALEVASKSAHSLVVDLRWDWVNPRTCEASWLEIPNSDCATHQIATYELEEACPATRNGFHCQ